MKNINIEKTEKEFNYKISELKPNSEKLVYRICDICGKEELRKFRCINIMNQIKCYPCSNKINIATINTPEMKKYRSESIKKTFKDNGHPRQGVKHTEESKEKMRSSRLGKKIILSPEATKKLKERMSGVNNPFYGKQHTDENKKKMSESALKRVKRGKDSPLYGNKYYSQHVSYNDSIKMKSMWEIRFANYLDSIGTAWTYESATFPVIYEYEGKIKEGTYTPDFITSDIIYEVKGYWRDDAFVKTQAFIDQYPELNLEIIDKESMGKLGILYSKKYLKSMTTL
jgi:hypothetical protein